MRHLSLRHFRNLEIQDLEIPSEGLALVGANAQGKSNFLESIYYLETFRSFRGARDEQLVGFGQDVFRVEGQLEDPQGGRAPARLSAAFQRRGRVKKVTVDGVEPPRMSDGLGRLGAVIFSPSDVAMINEGPAERRRFLDIVLSLNISGYLRALQEYRQVLAQRNAILKEGAAAALVQVWNEPLVRAGARVSYERARWVDERSAAFATYYGEISGGQQASLAYRPSVEVPASESVQPVEVWADGFRAALAAARDREVRMGTTVVGPHRDELRITLDGEHELEVRDFGSGGQRRTAALGLRLIEAATIRDARGLEPLVLMDDVFAELDADRSERILDLIEREEAGQVILTAPKESDVRLRRDVLPRWGIRNGRIEA